MRKYFVLVATLAAGSAVAAVSIDSTTGNGFVGKGDVQSLYDWNNSMLQQNAGQVRFRYIRSSSSTWQCRGINPAGNVVLTTHGDETYSVSSSVAYTARRNSQDQITGFVLNGFADYGQPSYTSVGRCPSNSAHWRQQPTLVPDSIVYRSSEEPVLQVSIDGVIWLDLTISY